MPQDSHSASGTGPGNRLLREKSPYLLQHAHNPVDWYPWGEEAFARARAEDKPIFLSVGYSTCHWCHVMAHESFEDESIAAFLNAHFVAVKVDREERPDVDRIYMLATQAISGSGGWPMTVLLTPALEPFYAGTYFAPQSRPGMPGLDEVLRAIHRLWTQERGRIDGSAAQLRAMLSLHVTTRPAPETVDDSALSALVSAAARQYDPVCGGFGDAPKFPRPALLRGLLCAGSRSADAQALDMVTGTLRGMARGGMRDHLGGGFHRYSTDRYWCVPHFEKMLYDQAQLAVVYLEAHLVAGDDAWARDAARIATETLDYVLRDLRDPLGGFYSAEDADSAVPEQPYLHAEGAFYLWRAAEIDALLGDAAPAFRHVYGIRDDGNAPQDPMQEFVGKNLLFEVHAQADAAETFDMNPADLAVQLDAALKTLLRQRQQRPRPHLDDKVIVAWNGMTISALARAAQLLERPDYAAAAAQAADFLLSTMLNAQGLRRRYRDGEVAMAAQLEDYAALVQGLLDLYATDFAWRWLDAAQRLTTTMIERFADPAGGFFETADEDPTLLLRMKEAHDGAEPAANSVAALNLLRLGTLCCREDWFDLGRATVAAFAAGLREQPMAMPQLLLAAQFASAPPRQIVIAGAAQSADTRALLREAWRHLHMNTVLILADGGAAQQQLAAAHPELAAMTPAANGSAQAYVCRNFSCAAPVSSAAALTALLATEPA